MAHAQHDRRKLEVKFSVAIAAVVATVLSTAPAYADLGDQLAKLLPNDGATFDEFGGSVAISDTIALIGARDEDDNRTLHLIYFKEDVGQGDLSLCSA